MGYPDPGGHSRGRFPRLEELQESGWLLQRRLLLQRMLFPRQLRRRSVLLLLQSGRGKERKEIMIRTILWDVDGTLLDFHAAEGNALRSLFREFGFGELNDEDLARYKALNISLWKALERNEITKPRVLVGRFEKFFGDLGLDPSLAPAFNEKYQVRLGDTIVFLDDSYEIVKSLRGRVSQYVVSNGTVQAQTKKLEASGLGELMDGVFLSEAIGTEKPGRAFFDAVFARIRPESPDQIVIIGDALSSDILGGDRAGIRTCWYNPHGAGRDIPCRIDYEIRDLHQVLDLPLA